MVTILFVDDQQDLATVYKMMLELTESTTVTLAYDGEKALALARSLHPDVIITDMKLPRLTGLELIRQLRADESTESIPIIGMSADGSYGINIAEHGMDAFLQKTFEFVDLQATIKAVLAINIE